MTEFIANAITTKLTEYIPAYKAKIEDGIKKGIEKMSPQQAQFFMLTWNEIGRVVSQEVAKKQQAPAPALPAAPAAPMGGRKKRNKKTLKRKSH